MPYFPKLKNSINSNFRPLDRELNLKALKANDKESLVNRLETLPEYIKANDYPDLEPSPNTYFIS